jgi:Flp pilus assembly pilin Flp
MIEYALMAALIAIVAIAAISSVGTAVSLKLSTIASAV